MAGFTMRGSQRLSTYRRKNKILTAECQALQASCLELEHENAGHKSKYDQLLARVARLEAATKKPPPKRKSRKGGAYFIGFVTGAVIALLVFYILNSITLSLEIPPGGVNGVITLRGNHVAPGDFLSDIDKMEDIRAEFLNPEAVDFYQAGMQEVVLTLRNGRRVSEAHVVLNIIEPQLYFQLEAGSPSSYVSPDFFVPPALVTKSDVPLDVVIHSGLPQHDILEVGRHVLSVSVNGVFFHPELNVVDTTPPSAVLTDITIPMGQEVALDDFIMEYFDISPVVRIWFVKEPDIFTPGVQPVEIGFEDYFGNQAVYSAYLTVSPNNMPPQIFGTQDILVQIGSPIIFRLGVSAEDAFGRPLEFFVDSSNVNIHELGTYTVIYYTVDDWGLRTEAVINVTVLEVDPERVREMAQAVLDNILREDMTQAEEARAIFDWTQNNVAYAANISRGSVYEGAYQALRNRRGDCFVFYAISEVLLTQAGIPNMHIRRIETATASHSWNLINPDGLGWHHFDATPLLPINEQRLNRFMFTSSQARWNTQLIHGYLGTRDYYTYDPELYPEIVQ